MAIQDNDVEMATEEGDNAEKEKTPKVDIEALALAGMVIIKLYLNYSYWNSVTN